MSNKSAKLEYLLEEILQEFEDLKHSINNRRELSLEDRVRFEKVYNRMESFKYLLFHSNDK